MEAAGDKVVRQAGTSGSQGGICGVAAGQSACTYISSEIVECLCTNRNCSDETGHENECQCFMFRSRRNTLVKRLWKSRPTRNETQRPSENASPEAEEDSQIKSVTQAMLKRLKEKHLEVLIQSVESKGGETTDCVLLPKGDVRLGRRTLPPHILCCQIWRWPDLEGDHVLKRLPCCQSSDDPTSICCNPYHWSRLAQTGRAFCVVKYAAHWLNTGPVSYTPGVEPIQCLAFICRAEAYCTGGL